MSFWGMSQQGKDARNAVSGIANQQTQNGQYWNDWGKDQANKGNEANSWAYDYWKNANQQGAPTVGQNRSAGQDIYNYGSATADDWKRLAQTQDYWNNNVPKAADTMNQINGNLDTMGGNVGINQDANQGTIDNGYRGMADRSRNVYNQNTGQINDTFGKAQGDWNGSYDAMGNRITGLLGQSKDAYGQMGSNVDAYGQQIEKLNPAGEFRTAQTARQFAPAMAAEAGRLRRSGIDPNSIQASSALGNVETDRARAMDDAAAAGTMNYVNAQGQLTGMKNNVLQSGLNTDIGLVNNQNALGQNQAQGNQSMTLGQGNALVNQNSQNLATQNALDANRVGQTLDNQNASFAAGQNVLGLRNQAALTGNALGNQDFNTYNQMMKDQSAQSQTDLNRNLTQYQLGQQQNAADLQQRNLAGQQIGQLGQQQMNNGLNSAQLGSSQLGQAAGLQNQIYNNEAANAGWGSKMLLGAGLNLATGGLGSIGGLMGGGSGGGFNTNQYMRQYGGG